MMDVIGNSLGNGDPGIGLDGSGPGIVLDESEVEHKSIVVKASLRDTSKIIQSQPLTTSKITFRMPVDNSFTDASPGTIYRVLPLKVEPSMEAISEAEVPVTPILSSHLHATDSSEPRLALIASSDSSADSSPAVMVSGGQVFVISDASNVTTSGRPFIPRATDTVVSQRFNNTREEKRRVTHNEVERRRRDKINSWICKLAKILPECSDMQAKSNQASKGGILAKACDYIEQLRSEKKALSDKVIALESMQQGSKILVLEQDIEILKNENAHLKAQLHRNVDDLPS